MLARLALGIFGLACLSPYLAWSRSAGSTDVLFAAALSAPVLAAVLASRPSRRAASHLASGATAGILAASVIAGFGQAAWLVLVLLLAEPADEYLSGRVRSAVYGLLGTAAGLAAAAAARAAGLLGQTVAPEAAGGFLLLQVLVLAGAAAWSRDRAIATGLAKNPPVFDTVPLAAMSDLVTWHDAFGDVLKASAPTGAMFGTPSRSLVDGGFLARVHVSDRPRFLKALSDAANGSEPTCVEFRFHGGGPGMTPDFDVVRSGLIVTSVEMRAHRLAQVDGAGASVIAFTRDSTTQRLHAEELEKARAEAERANLLKANFLATVSHELRTPLNAIIGFSELLSADHPFLITEERRREYASIIRSSGRHLLELVNTLLDMSKIETGNFHFEPEPFDFRELAVGACDLIQLKADEAGVRLERGLDIDLPEIVADRRACRQILLNLVSNAVKFTPAGGLVTVTLTGAQDALVLEVADTGIGIPEADLPRLGDPFFQSGDVHRRNHEGTGLGLSVVRGLVGLHGGRMSIESGAGAGTTVTVTLPMTNEDDSRLSKPVAVHTFPRVSARAPERKTA